MYTVLKTKRFQFEIAETEWTERVSRQFVEESKVSRQSNDMIISSCFLDDVFVLFLFNSGHYLIVNTTSSQPQQQKNQKKSQTAQSQIVYQGHILHQIQRNLNQQNSSKQQKLSSTTPRKLLPKNSLNFIEESYTKIIFSECKRILLNQCIIITKHSASVFWLKLVKKSVQKSEDLSKGIKTEIKELPSTMFGDILRLDKTYATMNMTVITELNEFDNTTQSRQTQKKSNLTKYFSQSKGSFYIKNEIIEDKIIYFTFYTRIPQNIRQKHSKGKTEQISQIFESKLNIQIPDFIITKFEFAIPINEMISNFVIEISDKFSNEIAIYKQFENDQTEWQIKLFSFGFKEIGGEDLLVSYLKNGGETQKQRDLRPLAIQNAGFIPKPKTIILPQQFTSFIHIQQFIRIDNPEQNSKQSTYLIVSINQTQLQLEELPFQTQITEQQLGQAYRVNGELVYFDQNGHIRPRQNTKTSNKCWTHICKLIYQENSEQFTQWIEKVSKFKFPSTSFLKIININYEQKLLYVLRFAHERVNNQLYENKLDLVSLQSGEVVEKGYLSLKNYSFSPNQRYILDVPQIFSTQEEFFFHIRLLFDKKTLYMFMIENSKEYFEHIQDANFIQTILNLL